MRRIFKEEYKFKTKLGIVFLILTGVCLGSWLIANAITTSPFRKALPSTAKEIREWRWQEPGPLGQDFIYMLSAKISEEEFHEYISELNLVSYVHNDPYDISSPNWYMYTSFSDEVFDWWRPTESSKNTYAYIGKSYWEYAKYENGTLYLYSFNI